MKQAMVNYIKNPINDELYTPEYAVKPLLPYLPPEWRYWEPTDPGESKITKVLRDHGRKIKGTKFNFLENSLFDDWDAIITNPPYSLKTEFLQRAFELGKPFAFLLPLTALEGIDRGKLFATYGISLLIFNRRVHYIAEKRGVWYNTSWFCWKILPQNLTFIDLQIGEK